MFELCESIVSTEEKSVKTYGLRYGSVEIRDISPDKERVKELINTLNRNGASPIHIYDIIDDFLSLRWGKDKAYFRKGVFPLKGKAFLFRVRFSGQ